jgi:hypothetical protein
MIEEGNVILLDHIRDDDDDDDGDSAAYPGATAISGIGQLHQVSSMDS